MLQELNIRNFAIIEKANIEFSEGLNILSGETGAGKSLVFDAILAVLGGKLTKEDIRFGSDKLIIEALFINILDETRNMLNNFGIEIEEDGIIITREYSFNGKSVCRVNGRIVSLSILKDISSSLVDLIGQHDHQKLLSNEKHLELLDSLGNKEIKESLENIENIVTKHSEIVLMRKKHLGSPEERARAADLLSFQIEEIENASLFEFEEDELKERRILVLNGEKIFNSVTCVFSGIYENENNGIRDLLATNIKTLSNVSIYDREIERFSTT